MSNLDNTQVGIIVLFPHHSSANKGCHRSKRLCVLVSTTSRPPIRASQKARAGYGGDSQLSLRSKHATTTQGGEGGKLINKSLVYWWFHCCTIFQLANLKNEFYILRRFSSEWLSHLNPNAMDMCPFIWIVMTSKQQCQEPYVFIQIPKLNLRQSINQ
jgi:hypothetical protein